MQVCIVQADAARSKINAEGSDLNTRRRFLHAVATCYVAFGNAKARQQFTNPERLGNVVVCTVVKRYDLVGLPVTFRYNDNRLNIPFAQPTNYFGPVGTRQVKIDNY